MSIIIAPHTVHILYCRWNRAIIWRRNFFQSQKAGKRNWEWWNTRMPRKAAIIMIMRSQRQKYQRAWPESLKIISTPRPEKCPLRLFNHCAGCGLACGHVTEMLLILWKKLFSTWLFEGKSLIWSSNFVRGQSVAEAETCFSYWG